jgi:inner membrane protein
MLGGMNKPLAAKLAILALVTLLLCAVLSEIGGLVRERQQRQQEAAAGVEDSMAGAQTLLGPLLLRHCKESWVTPKDGPASRQFTLTAPPTALDVSGGLSPEARHRGLFKVNVYTARLALSARWADLRALAPQAEQPGSKMECGEVLAMLSTTDTRGLRLAQLKLGGQALAVRPGTHHPVYRGGLHAVLPAQRLEDGLQLALQLELAGSQRLALVPAAGSTRLSLQSSWPHPSFGGRFLPSERQVGVSGFSAQWNVSELASAAAADAISGKAEMDSLSVALLDPVNPYVMSDRAIKYGLIFIALTFVTVGLTELLTGRRVHPVQYLLVGLALSLFFLLLLSLSEHLPFALAYAVAAGAAAGLLGHYGSAMLGGWRRGAAFGGGIALLYGALYVLLSREQAALVIGALLLFTVLAVVMALTRRLDWYGLGR